MPAWPLQHISPHFLPDRADELEGFALTAKLWYKPPIQHGVGLFTESAKMQLLKLGRQIHPSLRPRGQDEGASATRHLMLLSCTPELILLPVSECGCRLQVYGCVQSFYIDPPQAERIRCALHPSFAPFECYVCAIDSPERSHVGMCKKPQCPRRNH